MNEYNVEATKEPLNCPRVECESEDIEAGRMNTDSSEAWRLVTCNTCGFEWNEIYTFSFWEARQHD